MTDENTAIPPDLENFRKLFGYLFERGYEVHSINDSEDVREPGKVVMLKKDDLYLNLHHEQSWSWYELYFGSPSKGFLKIGSIIYFLSDEKDVFGNSPAEMERDANLLSKYIDDMESRFRDDYSGFWDGVQATHWNYERLFEKSLPLPILGILYFLLAVVFFELWNELVFGWLLSAWLLELGYDNSSLLIKGASVLVAIGTAYIIFKATQKPNNETQVIVAPAEQGHKKNPL
jgi:hypothetical protein